MANGRFWTDKDLSTPIEEWGAVENEPSNTAPSYYNSEHYYNGQYPGMNDSTPPTPQSYAEIEAELRRKEFIEDREIQRAAGIQNYEDAVLRMAQAERNRRNEEQFRLEQYMSEETKNEQRQEKSMSIAEAKKRYNKLNPFTKLFIKKIDYFRRGIGYYNPDEMSNEQIDSLYQGKSR